MNSHNLHSMIKSEYLNRSRFMPDIQISVNGILKLLNNFKPGKAAGPDSIQTIMHRTKLKN